MSISTTTRQDVEAQVKASVLTTLTDHLTMDRGQVVDCLDGTGGDVKIASRVAILVIARAQKVFGVSDLVDPKRLRPEQVTSVCTV
ncbi:MAG: hypothetical protein M3450_05475, partial [Actinomycetota bacterium]|nr:hypothetical protein [Actinomycetota bacterium]